MTENNFMTRFNTRIPRPVQRLLPVLVTAILLAGGPSLAAQDQAWGHLTGRIVVSGDVPEPDPLTISTDDRQYCLDTDQEFRDRSLLVGEKGGLQNAYVMMYFKRGDRNRPAVHPSYSDSTAGVTLDNVNCQFQPNALFVRTGQTLELKNSDRIGHNCHVVTMGNEENPSLGAGQTIELQLEVSDRVPGIVKCDAHPWMQAILLVRDEPYVAITDAEGRFKIENLPAGEWTFQFWHKRTGFLKKMTRDGETFLGRRGEITVTIPADGTLDLGEMQFPADELQK